MADTLRGWSELALDVLRVLPGEWGRPQPEASGTVTGGARGDAALRVAGECQASAHFVLSEAAAALRSALGNIRMQPAGATCEMSCDIGRILDRDSLGQHAHRLPQPLPRAVVGELFVDRRCIHPVERRDEVPGIRRRAAVAAVAGRCGLRTPLRISGADLSERGLGPGDVGGRTNRRLDA